MGRKALVTEKRVHELADIMKAANEKPSAKSIYAALREGSLSTIQKHFNSWKAKQPNQEVTFAGLPPAITQALANFVTQEIEAVSSVLKENLNAAQQDNQDLISESEQNIATIDMLENDLQTAQMEKAELAGRVAELANNFANAQLKVEEYRQSAEKAREVQARLETRIEWLAKVETEAVGLRQSLEQERSARSAAEQQAAVTLVRLEKSDSEILGLQTRLNKSELEIDELRGNKASLAGKTATPQKRGS